MLAPQLGQTDELLSMLDPQLLQYIFLPPINKFFVTFSDKLPSHNGKYHKKLTI